MGRTHTTRVAATFVALAFALNGSAPASPLAVPDPSEGPAHMESGTSSADGPHEHHQHSQHHQQTGDCTCTDACTTIPPTAAGSDAETFPPPDLVERAVTTPRASTPLPRGLRDYLFPLPNAPPFRA